MCRRHWWLWDDGSLALDGDVGDFGHLKWSGAAATALAAADDLVVVSSCEPANVARLLSNVSAIRSLAPSARMHVVINRVRTPIVRNEAAAEELRGNSWRCTDAAHVLRCRGSDDDGCGNGARPHAVGTESQVRIHP